MEWALQECVWHIHLLPQQDVAKRVLDDFTLTLLSLSFDINGPFFASSMLLFDFHYFSVSNNDLLLSSNSNAMTNCPMTSYAPPMLNMFHSTSKTHCLYWLHYSQYTVSSFSLTRFDFLFWTTTLTSTPCPASGQGNLFTLNTPCSLEPSVFVAYFLEFFLLLAPCCPFLSPVHSAFTSSVSVWTKNPCFAFRCFRSSLCFAESFSSWCCFTSPSLQCGSHWR